MSLIDSRLGAGDLSENIGKARIVAFLLFAADAFFFILTNSTVRKQWLYGPLVIFKNIHGRIDSITTIDWFVTFSIVFLVGFLLNGFYTRRRLFWEELKVIVTGSLIAGCTDALLFSVSPAGITPTKVFLFWSGFILVLPLYRRGIKGLLSRAGWWQIPTTIIGSGENAEQTVLALEGNGSLGFRIGQVLAPAETPPPAQFVDFLARQGIPLEVLPISAIEARIRPGSGHILLAPEENAVSLMKPVVDSLSLTPARFDIVPPVRGLPLYGLEVGHIFGSEILMLRPRNNLSRLGPRLMKRAFDLVVSLALLIVLGAPMLWIAWRIRRTGAKALFRHQRVGRNGKPFHCFKFQTMVPNADRVLARLLDTDPAARREWEKNFKLANDPRITPIGRFLRETSLDELPQLLNVVKGDMSLVGPRPIVEAEIARYADDINYYYEVTPGISGLWQISGRSDVDYPRRIFLDTWYVKNWSLWYDFVILLKTAAVVLNRSGAY